MLVRFLAVLVIFMVFEMLAGVWHLLKILCRVLVYLFAAIFMCV